MRLSRAVALAALACGLVPAPAGAAPYTVWSCRDEHGAPLPASAWVPAGNAGTRADGCAAGGALSVTLTAADTAPGAVSGYRFHRPPGVTISGYTAWLAAETAAVPSAQGEYAAGMAQGDELSAPTVLDGCGANAPMCASGSFDDPLAPGNERSQPMMFGGLALVAACVSQADPCEPAADPPARTALFRSAVVLDDPTAPVVDAPTVTTVAGARRFVADVRDAGSGVRAVELLVDGRVADRREGTGTCAPPYTVADPCPSAVAATFVLDAAALGDGAHEIAVRASDAALNETTGAATTVVVDRAAAPREAAPVLRLLVPRRVRLPATGVATGTAIDADGTPRPGVPIRFQRRPFGGTDADWRDAGAPTLTDAAGRFRIPPPPTSAQVRALVASPALAGAPATTGFVRRLRATIRPSARRLRNGQRLTLTGRLRNAGGAAAGRTVLIQSRVRGTWRSVDSAQSRAGGRIVWRYRFTNTRRTARYRFRFVIPRTKPLPWERLTTRQISVLVRPG